jgi:hypothetical protein
VANKISSRERKRPERPYRSGEWLGDVIVHGRECTAVRAWTQSRNLAGLQDGLVDAAAADERERIGSLQADETVPVPRWVVDGLLDYLKDTYRHFNVSPGPGRHARWVERYRQDAKDFTRFDSVYSHHLNHGMTWPEAYSATAEDLKNTIARGPTSTMEQAYKRVMKALRAGQWGRYYRSRHIRIPGLGDPF